MIRGPGQSPANTPHQENNQRPQSDWRNMKLSYHTLDVFTHQRFAGNPLAIVLGADDLSTDEMRAIAHEFHLSETVFVQKPQIPAHSARVRTFTPRHELPFAGHPTLGTAILLASQRAPTNNSENDFIITLEETIGTVRVGVKAVQGEPPFAEFDAPKMPKNAGALPPKDTIAAGLGLLPNEIGFENHEPICFAAGPTFAFIPITNRDAMAQARVSHEHWARAFENQGILGAYLYTRECVHTTSAFHARMFAPGEGIDEDPATGSAAICLTAVIHHFDGLQDGPHKHVIEQGYVMGRPSHITVTSIVREGRLDVIRIGGHAVHVASGEIWV